MITSKGKIAISRVTYIKLEYLMFMELSEKENNLRTIKPFLNKVPTDYLDNIKSYYKSLSVKEVLKAVPKAKAVVYCARYLWMESLRPGRPPKNDKKSNELKDVGRIRDEFFARGPFGLLPSNILLYMEKYMYSRGVVPVSSYKDLLRCYLASRLFNIDYDSKIREGSIETKYWDKTHRKITFSQCWSILLKISTRDSFSDYPSSNDINKLTSIPDLDIVITNGKGKKRMRSYL